MWFTPNELWNKVMPERTRLLCPTCFIARAESKGIHPTGWELREESQPSEKGLADMFLEWKKKSWNDYSPPRLDDVEAKAREIVEGNALDIRK